MTGPFTKVSTHARTDQSGLNARSAFVKPSGTDSTSARLIRRGLREIVIVGPFSSVRLRPLTSPFDETSDETSDSFQGNHRT